MGHEAIANSFDSDITCTACMWHESAEDNIASDIVDTDEEWVPDESV